ncbi:MAG TPA: hypothetical protein VGZ49_00980 [Xanthobacteraceae bacterium]|jgi:hypothetical protein|nr:hypothetical protein [Xanthobacteraceae bacterium]
MDQELVRILTAAGLAAFAALLKFIFDKIQQLSPLLHVTVSPNHFRLPAQIQSLFTTYITHGIVGTKPKAPDERLIKYLLSAKNLHIVRIENRGKGKCENIRIRRALPDLTIFDLVDSSTLLFMKSTTHITDQMIIPSLQPGASVFVLAWTFDDDINLFGTDFFPYLSRSVRKKFEITADNAQRIRLIVHLHEEGPIHRGLQTFFDKITLRAFGYLANVVLVFFLFWTIYSLWPIFQLIRRLF